MKKLNSEVTLMGPEEARPQFRWMAEFGGGDGGGGAGDEGADTTAEAQVQRREEKHGSCGGGPQG